MVMYLSADEQLFTEDTPRLSDSKRHMQSKHITTARNVLLQLNTTFHSQHHHLC